MSAQTLYITQRGYLSIDKNQLVIKGHYTVRVPVEDIATVVIESRQVTITSACLAYLAERCCSVIVCGPDYMPRALQLPFMPHSRQAMINRKQLAWSDAFKKRCHQTIIQKKIANQARALEILQQTPSPKIVELSKRVGLGDKTHVEAQAAARYFALLLEGHSRRNTAYYYNNALNYGYAIIRSRVAQALTAAGFIPSVGLFHRSELNNYNLADDILEPYRPLVDVHVFYRLKQENAGLSTQDKAHIMQLTEMEITAQGTQEKTAISQLVKQSVHSLSQATESGQASLLQFPEVQIPRERCFA